VQEAGSQDKRVRLGRGERRNSRQCFCAFQKAAVLKTMRYALVALRYVVTGIVAPLLWLLLVLLLVELGAAIDAALGHVQEDEPALSGRNRCVRSPSSLLCWRAACSPEPPSTSTLSSIWRGRSAGWNSLPLNLRPSYRRGTVMQATCAAVGLLSSLAAWLAGATVWWLIAGVLLGLVIPFTLTVILPTNKRSLSPALDRGSAEAKRLLAHWGRLHAVRSVLSGLALLLFLYLAIFRKVI
jgi:hypothetical protein